MYFLTIELTETIVESYTIVSNLHTTIEEKGDHKRIILLISITSGHDRTVVLKDFVTPLPDVYVFCILTPFGKEGRGI